MERAGNALNYELIDWFLDAVERGQCQSCKGFTLERMGTFEAQCYSCGRWFVGYDIGRAHSDLIHLSTSYQREETRRGHGQTYDQQRFEDELTHTPKSPEDYGDFPK